MAQTSALPCGDRDYGRAMRTGFDAFGEDREAFAHSFEIAGQRKDAGHGVRAVEGEACVAEQVERERWSRKNPSCTTPTPALRADPPRKGEGEDRRIKIALE